MNPRDFGPKYLARHRRLKNFVSMSFAASRESLDVVVGRAGSLPGLPLARLSLSESVRSTAASVFLSNPDVLSSSSRSFWAVLNWLASGFGGVLTSNDPLAADFVLVGGYRGQDVGNEPSRSGG